MRLTFRATATATVKGITGDNGISHQALGSRATIVNGDSISVVAKPNPYLPPDAPWRLLTDSNSVLPWEPEITEQSAADIIDYYAYQLAMRRPA